MKIRSTGFIVLVYVILLVGARSEEASADPYIELGKLFESSDATIGGIGYEYKNWDFNLSFIGEGTTDWGTHPKVKVISVNRLIYPGWIYGKFFMGVGIARLDSDYDVLTEAYNFRPSLGFDFGQWKIYYHHYSSADINEQNTGINAVSIRVEL